MNIAIASVIAGLPVGHNHLAHTSELETAIGSPIAIYAVKQAIKFDDSKRVSKLCANFYSEHLKNNFFDEEINVDVSKTALK